MSNFTQEDADCCLSRHLFIGKLRECQSCECQCLFPFIFIQVPHLATTDSEFYESQPLLLYSLPKNARAWHKRKASKAKNRGCLTSSRQKTLKTPKLVRKTHLDLEIYPDAAWVFVRVKAENPGRSLRVFVSSTVFVWLWELCHLSLFYSLFTLEPLKSQPKTSPNHLQYCQCFDKRSVTKHHTVHTSCDKGSPPETTASSWWFQPIWKILVKLDLPQ